MPKAKKQDAAPTFALLELFDQLHTAKLGRRAVFIRGKDGARVRDLVASQGAAGVADLMRAFFASEDRWIADHGYTVGVFASQAGKLLALEARRAKADAWIGECDRLHGGACETAMVHRLRIKKGAGDGA